MQPARLGNLHELGSRIYVAPHFLGTTQPLLPPLCNARHYALQQRNIPHVAEEAEATATLAVGTVTRHRRLIGKGLPTIQVVLYQASQDGYLGRKRHLQGG